MDKFALLSLYRSLARHKFYAALNILGLAAGISVFLVLGLYVRFQSSFETGWPDHDQIYVVESAWHIPDNSFNGAFQSTMGGLLEEMRQDFPRVIGTRINGGEGGGSVVRNGVATTENVAEVDATFGDVFRLSMREGTEKALSDPAAVLVSRAFAQKTFGDGSPIGQTLTVITDKTPKNYQVAGVFEDLPKNTDLKFDILVPLPPNNPQEGWHQWGNASLTTYLRFPTPRAAQGFAERLPPFVDRRGLRDIGPNAAKSLELELLPLTAAHLTPQGDASASAKMILIALSTVGLLTLLIAIINYVNLATAGAGLRAREVAIRKALGASKSVLVRQFMGEAVLTVAIAAMLSLIFAELCLPLVNAAGGLSIEVPYSLVVPALAALTVVVGVLAGVYPALLLSSFPAASVLASARSPGGGRSGSRLREVLVILQFGLATAFLIGTMVLVAQTRHVRQTDLGFKREGLIVIKSLRDSQIDGPRANAIAQGMRELPGVLAVGIANGAAGGSGTNNAQSVKLPGRQGAGPSLRWISVGSGFFDAYAPRLVAGRLFDSAHGTDDSTDWAARNATRNIVINQKAVATLGFASAQDSIGKTVGGDTPMTIIGVIGQLRFFSPRQPDDPTFYVYSRELQNGAVATIRFSGDLRAMLAQVRSTWRQLSPTVPIDADTAEDRLAKYYEEDDRTANLFAVGAGIAIVIGCVGLWGLASFSTARRVKEIGIRKSLGASSGDIVRLLVGQFIRPVLVANLVAWPLALIATRTWLAGYDDRIALSPLYFIAGSLLALVVAVLTVIGQSLRASRSAPSWALRHD
jgi:putative ABC transport system permease protein